MGRRQWATMLLSSRLGSGSFSVVWRGVHNSTGEEVAIKEVPTEKLSGKLQESLESEISILGNANHPNIVRLLDIVKVLATVSLCRCVAASLCRCAFVSLYWVRHGVTLTQYRPPPVNCEAHQGFFPLRSPPTPEFLPPLEEFSSSSPS